MLTGLGVTVRTGAMVTDVRADGVTIREGERTEDIPTRTILWAAGVLASPLGRILGDEAGAKLDRFGRVVVEPDMSIAGHPEIFVIGDLANFSHQTGKPLPGVAQPAIQQGAYVAKLIRVRLVGKKYPPFHYFDKGNLATIGRGAAVADLNWLRPFRLAGLAHLGLHPSRLHHPISKPRAGNAAVGLALHYFRPFRAPDHRQKSASAGFVR